MNIFLCSCLAFFALASPAFAQTLLIVSDSAGMFGEGSAAMEKYAAEMVRHHIGPGYRRVYTIYGESDGSAERFIRAIVRNQLPGEKIDIFAMRHTGGSVLPGMGADRAETIIPRGMLRRFYSSGCSDWGDFERREGDEGFDFKADGRYIEHLKRLEIEEYVVHANFNATMPVLLPLLLPELKKGGSWVSAAERAYGIMDALGARVTPELLLMQEPLERFFGTSDLPFLRGGLKAGLYTFFESRPVLGGTAVAPAKFAERNLLVGEGFGDPIMVLLAPSPGLMEMFRAHLPNIFFRRHADLDAPVAGGSLSRGTMGFASLLARLMRAWAGNEEGCVDPAPVQHLVDYALVSLEGEVPRLEKLCMSETDDGEFTFRWRLGPTAVGRLWQRARSYDERHDFWFIRKHPDLAVETDPDLHSMTLEREGSLRIFSNGKLTGAEVEGVGLNLKSPSAFKVPESLLHFGLGRFSATEGGDFKVRVKAPFFNLPFGADAQSKGKGEIQVKYIRVLGIPFRVEI